MPRKPNAAIRGALLCLAASSLMTTAHAALLNPTWSLRSLQPDPTSGRVGDARTDFAPDPVLPVLESIGQSSDAPRLDAWPRAGASQRLSGGDGAAESVFPGGVASTNWTQRVFEGVIETRVRAQSEPPEPSVARPIGAPPPGPLLAAAVIALIVLRNRSRLARRWRAS